MARRTVQTLMPFTPEQMYDLVVDMDQYPDFLPWCVKARKYEVTEASFKSEITFAFKAFRETFYTLDHVEPGRKVTITHTKGPFRHLESEWRFTPMPQGTQVDFFIDFRFKNPVLELALGPVFAEASRRMVEAFRKRAKIIYPA